MLRFVVILLAAVLLISVLRSVIGLILRGFSELLNSSTAPQPKRPEVPVAGELKKDPVCGMFVPAASAIKQTAGAETVYFCSEECKSKYQHQ